jgi:electron transfer flavoprotein alpha subunit
VLAPGTVWGREVASRAAAALGAGLTGDAVALELEAGRLVAWKPAFGGALVAAVTATGDPQLVTVRAGMLPQLQPRVHRATTTERLATTRGRIRVLARTRDDDLDVLADAHVVIGVGQGVAPEEYPALDPLIAELGAELAATRKVTDQGWLPRARQLGITGRSIAPRLYVAIGLSGKFNHMVGVRAAGTVVAVNDRPDALVFETADVGIVGDWHEVVPLLADAVAAARTGEPV